MSFRILIVAPHIDDEMIGCWSVMNRPDIDLTVNYVYELFDTRKEDAAIAAHMFGFRSVWGELPLDHARSGYDEVYVPSRRDWHEDHQRVNRRYRHWATHFYSVDMGNGVLLRDCENKRIALNTCYPSQRKLWTNNDKYWLFEDIQETDYDEYKTLAWTQEDGHNFSITVLRRYAEDVNLWCNQSEINPAHYFMRDRRAFMNALLVICTGKVIVEYKNIKVEA
jgi:hypothetical protein